MDSGFINQQPLCSGSDTFRPRHALVYFCPSVLSEAYMCLSVSWGFGWGCIDASCFSRNTTQIWISYLLISCACGWRVTSWLFKNSRGSIQWIKNRNSATVNTSFYFHFSHLILLSTTFVLSTNAFLYLPYVPLILFALCSPMSLKLPHSVPVYMPVYFFIKALSESHLWLWSKTYNVYLFLYLFITLYQSIAEVHLHFPQVQGLIVQQQCSSSSLSGHHYNKSEGLFLHHSYNGHCMFGTYW